MLSFAPAITGYGPSVAPMAPMASARASVKMAGEIVLADKAVQDKINAVVCTQGLKP